MKTKVESFLEIVFENRNKDYGAYSLRKKNPRILLMAMLVGLFILSVAVSVPVIASYYNRSHYASDNVSVTADILKLPTDEPLPPPPPPPTDLVKVEQARFVAPQVVDEDVETNFGNQDEFASRNNPAPNIEIEMIVSETPHEQTLEYTPPQDIFTIVEEQPSFPGGDEARIRFLSENIKYPESAKEISIQGRVYVTFVVETDGSISNITILRGIGGGCDEEAVRVVSMMPRWEPGRQRGKAVRVQFNLPIKFTLQ